MKPEIKILYIDDEERNLTAFTRLFRRSYHITTASSAMQGGEILKNDVFHVVLVDQRMPGTTGSEFFKEIADLYPDTMRVLVTAYSDLNAIISAVNDGKLYKYISKPYKKEDMQALIDDAYQVQLEKTLKEESFSKYRDVFSNSTDAIFLFDGNGFLMDVNGSFLKILNSPKEVIIKKNVNNVLIEKLEGFESLIFNSENDLMIEDKEVRLDVGEESPIACLLSLRKLQNKVGLETQDLYKGTLKNINEYKLLLMNSMKSFIERRDVENENVVNLLHENTAQSLSGMSFILKQLNVDSSEGKETISLIRETLQEKVGELKEVCFNILPKSLEFGISGALEELASRIESNYETNCYVDIENELPDVSKSFRVMIFRVVQNALKGFKKNNETIYIHLATDEKKIYFNITGKVPLVNKPVLKEVAIEVECYGGNISEHKLKDDHYRYSIVFPLTLVV